MPEDRIFRLPRRHFIRRCGVGWARTADWLGAQRPLDLIWGATAIIAACAVAGHLLSSS